MSDTFTACTFVFVMSSIFWPFVFLVIDGSGKKLDYLNVLGTWFGSVATFGAVCVSLYLSLNHRYNRLKISSHKDGVFTVTIENFNKFSVAFRFIVVAKSDKRSDFENYMISDVIQECFYVGRSSKKSSYFLVDPLSVVVIEFSHDDFREKIPRTKVYDLASDEINYTIKIETLVYHQKFITSGNFNDMIREMV